MRSKRIEIRLPRERGQEMSYTIEATGLDGWMSFRYQYKVDASDFFGYAETREEAEAIIEKAGAK
jgi:hypothetical protein